MSAWTLPLVSLGAGIISFSSPRRVPFAPGYLSYVSAPPISGLEQRQARAVTFRAAVVVVVLGFTVAFTILGACVGDGQLDTLIGDLLTPADANRSSAQSGQ